MTRTVALTPAALRTLSRPEPPPDLHERISVAIRAEAARQQRRHRVRRAAIGLTAVLVFVVLLHGVR